MLAAHHPCRQSAGALLVAATVLAACSEPDLQPSIWPPPDFACQVEEMALRDGRAEVLRRLRIEATGVVVYGTSSRSLGDPEQAIALPVFDRLAVYELVPDCLRALARRLDRLGITTLDEVQGERGGFADNGLALRWRAFGVERVITARGRIHGPLAEILVVVNAHLPAGERWIALPADRIVVPVLRGVPSPLHDSRGALQAHEALLARHGEDRGWLLDAYALACSLGDRRSAEALLARWDRVESLRALFRGADDEGEAASSAILQRLLPPAGDG